jgi:hypothetical protein
VATTKDAWQIQPPGTPFPISIPARTADHWTSWYALQRAVANHGSAFKLPSITILDSKAEEVLREIFSVAQGRRGFGEIVIWHTLKELHLVSIKHHSQDSYSIFLASHVHALFKYAKSNGP